MYLCYTPFKIYSVTFFIKSTFTSFQTVLQIAPTGWHGWGRRMNLSSRYFLFFLQSLLIDSKSKGRFLHESDNLKCILVHHLTFTPRRAVLNLLALKAYSPDKSVPFFKAADKFPVAFPLYIFHVRLNWYVY